MTNTNGLDSQAIADLHMLLIRANKEQLPAIIVMVEGEIAKRELIKNSIMNGLAQTFDVDSLLKKEEW